MGKVKDIILGISIAVIFAFFIGFGIAAFYDGPERQDFCEGIDPSIATDSCPAAQKTPAPVSDRYFESCWCEQDCSGDKCVDSDTCFKTNPEYTQCQKDYDDAREAYSKNVFIIACLIGLITMIVGGFVLKHESVSPGLMGGGFLTILYGVVRYWEFAGDWLRFIILGFILAMLIYFAYRKFPFKS